MATTTNFGWETPDDTDLVKDGALAMRTLGNAIDASMVDLKGGTTGQVLSKTSNTDMDFTWVTTDDANAIQNAIVDAKGDLITATAADTPARLAVGESGSTLVADSAATTGLRWQASQAAGKNGVVNGGMDFWQRGTSFVGVTTNAYCADRWIAYRSPAGSTFSRQTSGLDGFLYSTRVARDSGNTSTSVIYLAQMLESQESYKYAGKTVVLSWYAKAGANFSAASSQMIARIYTGTGTDQNWIQTGYTGQATTLDNLTTITTSWVRYSASVTIPSTTTELSVTFGFTPVGTAGANDWFEVTGVQLELGSVPTTFSRAGGTLQGELAACQRYYCKSYTIPNAPQTAGDQGYLIGKVASNTVANQERYGIFTFPVTMRATPTVTIRPYTTQSNTSRVSNTGGTDLGANSGVVTHTSDMRFGLYNNSGGTLTTTDLGVIFYFEASIEL